MINSKGSLQIIDQYIDVGLPRGSLEQSTAIAFLISKKSLLTNIQKVEQNTYRISGRIPRLMPWEGA